MFITIRLIGSVYVCNFIIFKEDEVLTNDIIIGRSSIDT